MASTMDEQAPEDFVQVLQSLKASLSQTNQALNPLLSTLRTSPSSLDHSDGLSLLSVRPQLLLSYTHLLALLIADRLSPSSTEDSDAVSTSSKVLNNFSSTTRGDRSNLPNNVQIGYELVVLREVMERVKGMELKVGKQVDRLVKASEETVNTPVEDDPMSFKPNASALLKPSRGDDDDDDDDEEVGSSRRRSNKGAAEESSDGVYRPPRLTAMPYNEPTSRKGKTPRVARAPLALADYASLTSGQPRQESSTGLTSLLSHSSARKKKSLAQEQAEFEEENFTRLVLKSSDRKRREREEEEDAMGGSGAGGWNEVLGGLGGGNDGWDAVSANLGGGGDKRADVWERRERGDRSFGESNGGPKKKGKFEKDLGNAGKKKKRSRK